MHVSSHPALEPLAVDPGATRVEKPQPTSIIRAGRISSSKPASTQASSGGYWSLRAWYMVGSSPGSSLNSSLSWAANRWQSASWASSRQSMPGVSRGGWGQIRSRSPAISRVSYIGE